MVAIEGWACWLMLLPVFLIAASIAGIIGGCLKTKKTKNDRLNIFILILLPFLISPIVKKMKLLIRAYPHEIPTTTLDEHVVMGRQYFDVLNGEYYIQPLKDGYNRLHLKSSFKMKTSFNFYASWWAIRIMKDIQNNILQVEKIRSEQNNSV